MAELLSMVPVLFCDHKKWQPFHGHGDCYYYHMYMCIGESLGDTYQNINKLSLVGRITNDVHFLFCAFLCLLIQILQLSMYYFYNVKMFKTLYVPTLSH